MEIIKVNPITQWYITQNMYNSYKYCVKYSSDLYHPSTSYHREITHIICYLSVVRSRWMIQIATIFYVYIHFIMYVALLTPSSATYIYSKYSTMSAPYKYFIICTLYKSVHFIHTYVYI